jgi:hypothetical protein
MCDTYTQISDNAIGDIVMDPGSRLDRIHNRVSLPWPSSFDLDLVSCKYLKGSPHSPASHFSLKEFRTEGNFFLYILRVLTFSAHLTSLQRLLPNSLIIAMAPAPITLYQFGDNMFSHRWLDEGGNVAFTM